MGKKFTIDEFKLTFKKPAQPKGLDGKKKDSLEGVAKEMAKDDDRHAERFQEYGRRNLQGSSGLLRRPAGLQDGQTLGRQGAEIWLEKLPAAQDKVLDKLYGSKTMDEDAVNAELRPPHRQWYRAIWARSIPT